MEPLKPMTETQYVIAKVNELSNTMSPKELDRFYYEILQAVQEKANQLAVEFWLSKGNGYRKFVE